MIPIRLQLEGIYSYQQPQDIDFEHLGKAELFGIFGATGSGKSSILEAIGYAIYNKTERLPTAGRNYNMMNLKSNRLRIDFECRAGKEHATRYRFVVEGKRRAKKFDDVPKPERSTYRLEGGGWVPTDESPEDIIGLSYENFQRCIIIPQGKFEDFLTLGPADRSSMLQELFHLDKFDLKDPLSSLITRNNLHIGHTQGSLATFAQVTPEALEENRQAMRQLETEAKASESLLRQQQRDLDALEQLRELFTRRDEVRKRHEQLMAERPAHEARKQRLDRYQLAQVTFATAFNEFDRTAKTLSDTERLVQQKQDALAAVEAELAKKEKTFADTDKLFQTREQWLRKADELTSILSIRELQEVINNRMERVANGRKRIEEAARQQLTHQQDLQNHELRLTQLEAQRPDLHRIMAAREWFRELASLEEQVGREQKTRARLLDQIEAGRESKLLIAQKIGIDLLHHELPVARLLEKIEEQERDLLLRKETADQIRLQEELQHKLRQLAGSLSPGDPCPLCGSTEHEAITHNRLESDRLADLRSDLQKIEKHLGEIKEFRPQLERLRDDAKTLGQELKEADQAIALKKEAIDRHKAAFVWPEFEQEGLATIEQTLAEGQKMDQDIALCKRERQASSDQLRQAQAQLEKYRPELESLQDQLSQARGSFQAAVQNLKLLEAETELRRDPAQIQREISALKNDYNEIGLLHQTLQREVEERKGRLASLKGELSTLQGQRKDQAAEVARLSKKLDQLLEASTFETREQVRDILALALDLESEKDEIRRFEREETQVLTSLQDLEAQVQGRSFDLAAFSNLQEEIASQETRLQVIRQQIGGKQELGQRLEADLAAKQALASQLEALSRRADNLRLLEGLFRGSGFVNYISTVYLQNLCAAANERFRRLTANALSLEIDAENNFLVRDNLNGGHLRSVKTLSGGQTFQAALCLALSLSDQVQRQAEAPQNFFFLDEGFGTQDKHSLRTIFQTLKSLRQERRIVGVISHVEELQQEIDTYLHIVNDPERGSQVQRSWA